MRGTVLSSQNKTPQTERLERNEETSEEKRGVLNVPVVVEPVVVALPTPVVPVQVADVQVAVAIAVVRDIPPGTPPVEPFGSSS